MVATTVKTMSEQEFLDELKTNYFYEGIPAIYKKVDKSVFEHNLLNCYLKNWGYNWSYDSKKHNYSICYWEMEV